MSHPCFSQNVLLTVALFSSTGDKDTEVDALDYEGKVLNAGEKLQFNACGRSDSPTGTDGKFDLVDPKDGDKLIRQFYWSCPHGNSGNKWESSGANSNWIVESTGQNLGWKVPLGTITVDALSKVI